MRRSVRLCGLTRDYGVEVATADQLNVQVSGPSDGQPMLFVHGFGCDQHMWRLVAPAFEPDHRVVTFDLVGAGGSDPAAWDPARYVSLDAYADDILGVVHELDLHDVVLVGHSVSAMTGLLAAVAEPDRFAGWSWSARRRATSTRATTAVVSPRPTSPSCWRRSTATTSAGPPPWPR